MQLVKFAFVLLLLAVVKSDYYWGEYQNSIQYSYLPTTQLGTFEGSYTSSAAYSVAVFICQDDDTIFGAYDEIGLFSGTVTGNKAKGNWYEAGTGDCVFGEFEIELTTEGFTGWYNCDSSARYNWTETKKSPFRPDDATCGLMDLSSTASLSGRFIDDYGLPKDLCHDGNEATGSSLFLDVNGDTQMAFFEGVSHLSGKIFIGTYYTILPTAGAQLIYLDNQGNVRMYFWTGLNGTNGDTVINIAQFRDPLLHGTFVFTGPVTKTTSESCDDYSSIKTKVLNNLDPGYDDDNYYFVTSDFNYKYDDDGGDDDNAVDDEDYSSDASHVYWFFLPLLLAFIL